MTVLVDVIELNRLGRRLSREERRAQAPVRGELRIDRLWTDRDREGATVHAHLTPMTLEPLYNVKVKYWYRRNVVLVGMQVTDMPKRGVRSKLEQVWWVRIVNDADVAPF